MGTTTPTKEMEMFQMHSSKEDDNDRKWDYDGDDEADGEAWLSTSADDRNLPELLNNSMSANASSKSADAGQVEPEESHSLAAIPNVQSSNLMCNDDNDMMSPDEDDIDVDITCLKVITAKLRENRDPKVYDLKLVLQLRAKLILKRMIPLESFFDDVPEWIADKIRDFYHGMEWALSEEA